MAGKSRKILDMQTGNLTRKTQQERQAQEDMIRQPAGAFDKIPRKQLVSKEAVREWKRIVPELRKMDLIGNLDLQNVIGYCNAFAKYTEATEQLKTEPLKISTKNEKGDLIQTRPNPLIEVQTRYAAEMRRFEELCGLTIGSRLKWAATRTKQQEEKIESEFGAI